MKDEIRDIEVIHRDADCIVISLTEIDHDKDREIIYTRSYTHVYSKRTGLSKGVIYVLEEAKHPVDGTKYFVNGRSGYYLKKIGSFEDSIKYDLEDDFPHGPWGEIMKGIYNER